MQVGKLAEHETQSKYHFAFSRQKDMLRQLDAM